MTKRITKKLVRSVTSAQFEDAMKQYAISEKRWTEINAAMETETKQATAKYHDELAYLENRKKNALEVVETYCVEQKEVLFSKRRSIGTAYGIAGFRLGNPKLKTMRGINWAFVLERLKEKLPDYVRIIEEPAKDQLLANRNSAVVAPLLPDIGLQVVQEETFFIELGRAA